MLAKKFMPFKKITFSCFCNHITSIVYKEKNYTTNLNGKNIPSGGGDAMGDIDSVIIA